MNSVEFGALNEQLNHARMRLDKTNKNLSRNAQRNDKNCRGKQNETEHNSSYVYADRNAHMLNTYANNNKLHDSLVLFFSVCEMICFVLFLSFFLSKRFQIHILPVQIIIWKFIVCHRNSCVCGTPCANFDFVCAEIVHCVVCLLAVSCSRFGFH